MSQKKVIDNWKRSEYLIIKKRQKLNQIQRERQLIAFCYQISS